MRHVIAILFLLLSIGSKAYSQTTTVSGTIDIATAMSISVTNLTGVVSFSTPGDYTSGEVVANAATVAVKSNVLWVVSVAAQSANFQAMTTGASTNMPASVLGLRRNGNTTFLTMSTSAQTLKTGSRGGTATSGNSFNTDIELDPGFNYSAGTYNIGVVFTLTRQ